MGELKLTPLCGCKFEPVTSTTIHQDFPEIMKGMDAS